MKCMTDLPCRKVPRPREKRSAAFAMANMIGNVAQVYSPYLYERSSAPQYVPAMIANSAFVCGSIAFAVVLLLCLKRENLRLEEAEVAVGDGQRRRQEQGLGKPGTDVSGVAPGGTRWVEQGVQI